MTQAFTRYPLVEKALEEQRRIFSKYAGGLPAELQTATLRTLDLLDRTPLPVSDEKESILVMSVLMNCPPVSVFRNRNLTEDYNAEVQALAETHLHVGGMTEHQKGLAQIYSALFIAHGENLLTLLETEKTSDPIKLRDIRESIEDYLIDRKTFEKAVAPALLAIENALIEKTYATLSKLTPVPPKPPRGGYPPPAPGF